MDSGPVSPRRWLVLVALLSCLPVLGVFTTHRIFFIRDLSFFFWSRHLWLRQTLFGGEAPWWDPYVAGGQSAIADALNQLLMPVTLAVRLLPSDVVSFNLWVALPLPLSALGMFLFLRRRVPDAPAALGACAFALSGPVVSMLNTTNLSWSVALMPWVLWAVSRLEGRASSVEGRGSFPFRFPVLGPRFATLAILFALQALCGEPVTWASTGLVALAYAFCRPNAVATESLTKLRPKPPSDGTGGRVGGSSLVVASAVRLRGTRRRTVAALAEAVRRTATVLAALVVGALLAAAQLVPTAIAGVRAQRSALATPDFWSLHPFSLWEIVVPRLFGDYYAALPADLPWMGALNFGRDPLFYSLYVGPLVLLLALMGVGTRCRRNAFWAAIALVFLAAALGGYSPLYPLARRLFPPLLYFRFPVKYIVITLFAVAVLVAEGFAAVLRRQQERAQDTAGARGGSEGPGALSWLPLLGGSLALIGLVAWLAGLLMPDAVTRVAHAVAVSAHLRDPAAGAAFLARTAPPLLARTLALLLAGCLLATASRRRRLAAVALFGATCADLLAATAGLNLTTDIGKVAPPAWYTASAGPQRLYIGGRVRGFMNVNDPDGAPAWQIPSERTAAEGRMALNAELPMAPSGWRVREALSYDLPHLWPAEYEATVAAFEQAGTPGRAAFLRRSGVRHCVLPAAESRQWRLVADVPGWNMRVFECDPGASRVFIASSVDISRDPSDPAWEREALFDPAIGDQTARLPAMPAVSGRAGPNEPPFARIVQDEAMRVVIEASAREGDVLVLRDSYDPSWTADVDGVPAAIERANGRYRAVALPAGRHVIRFSYRPRELAIGLTISGMGLLALIGFSRFLQFKHLENPENSDNPENPEKGFTLIELMLVLAIVAVLLAIAFNQFRGMQARGNDASALASLRSIAAAQWQFAMTCGNMRYASTLPALARPVPSTGEGFLSPDLTGAETFEKSGYTFQMAATPLESGAPACNGTVPADGYAATADPVRPGVTGVYFYGVNADRVIYLDDQQTYTGNLPESGAAGHGGEVK